MLFFDEAAVRRLLPMGKAVELLRSMFDDLAAGKAQNQPRRRLTTSSNTTLHSMAGAWGSYIGTKVYATNPKHGAWFLFWLLDAETGRPLALFEANTLGQLRTGAASGVATALLSRKDSVEACRIEAGDLLLGLDAQGWTRVEDLAGALPRANAHEITLFKSVGLGLEDVAVAGYIYEQAKVSGGTETLPMFRI